MQDYFYMSTLPDLAVGLSVEYPANDFRASGYCDVLTNFYKEVQRNVFLGSPPALLFLFKQ